MNLKQIALVSAGGLMVVLGTLGIVLPLLPTTPFLLLAGWLFAKSSPRCHDWLTNQRHLGPYISAWRNKTGLTRQQKIRISASFTIVMGISIYFAPMVTIKCFLGGIWAFWTVMLLRQKTLQQAT